MVHVALLAVLLTTLAAAPATPVMAASAACGDTLTTSVKLDADLACVGSALTVGADDIVIDLAGHMISGTTDNGIDNLLEFDRITVKNGTIEGFTNGIIHGGGEGHVIRDMRIRNGVTSIRLRPNVRFSKIQKSFVSNNSGNVILVEGDDNVVTRVVVTNGDVGIAVLGNRNVVSKNTVTNTLDGIALQGVVSGTTVSGNAVAASGRKGISFDVGGGTGNVLTKNRVSGSDDEGILIMGADAGVVAGNTVTGNFVGLALVNSDRNLVAKNVATANGDDGISIAQDCVATVLTGNQSQQNGDAGVSTVSTSSIVSKNVAFANATNGIEAPDGAVDGGGNKGRDNALEDCSPAFACK